MLPEAHFVHVIRDGRDVALSLRPMWFAPGTDIPTLATYWRRLVLSARSAAQNTRAYMEVRYEDVVRETESTIRSICRFMNLDFDREMLSYWLRTPERLKEHKTRVRNDGSIVVTHEQRLGQQALTLRPPERQRVFRWKQDMTRNEQDQFLRNAGGFTGGTRLRDVASGNAATRGQPLSHADSLHLAGCSARNLVGNHNPFGYLESCHSITHEGLRSDSVAARPLRSTTTAQTRSPITGHGAPKLSADATEGWAIRTSSISAGESFSPPQFMISFRRPVNVRYPSVSMTPESPVRNQPSENAVLLASSGTR